MRPTFDTASLEAFSRLIDGATRVALTCHMSPDGDALGSTMALSHVLRLMGKETRVVTPDEAPTYLKDAIPGVRGNVMAWSSFGTRAEYVFERADLIICLDFNAPYRVSRLEPALMAAKAPRVLIDHHEKPEPFCALAFSYPERSSTCELLYYLIDAMDWREYLDITTATCLLAGMITDTGAFQYNSNSGQIFNVVADLMDHGADKDWLVRCLINTHSVNSMQLEAFAIAERMTIYEDHHAALIVLSRDDLNRYSFRKGDTEGLVNRPLAIKGVVYSCFLREEEEYIKVSMRSVSDFSVEEVCSRVYGGGGHVNASGGEYRGSLADAIRVFEENLAANSGRMSQDALDYAARKRRLT